MSNPHDSPESQRTSQDGEEASVPVDFFERFFDEAPDMFASIDPATAIIKLCNRAMCDRLGYSKNDLIGKPLRELYHQDSHSDMQESIRDFAQEGHAEHARLKLVTAHGDPVHVSLRVSSHRDSQGRVLEGHAVWREISLDLRVERLELELRLQQAQKMESLALLAGGIAHDFNNMLMTILGNASICLLELPSESPVVSKINAIETASKRAADLTKQLLAYSGSSNHEQSVFDLSKVVEEMGHLLSVAISRKVVLNFDLVSEPVPVRGDVTQVRQIIMNLLTNASDAIGDRSGLVTVRTGLQMADDSYLRDTLIGEGLEPGYFAFLEISDTGQGIELGAQKKMFDPFFTTKTKGHGLGLAAVLGIVRGHNGTLRVYSELDNGTTIKVLLPTTDYEPDSATSVSEVRRANGEHVLLVDDEENALAVTKQMLEHFGFVVTTAVDGREAVSTYAESDKKFDLVLTDMTMPHLDGIGVYKAITRLDPSARVVLMSGYSVQQATNALTGRSFGGFLQKPFQPDALVNTVLAAIDG